MKSGGHLTLAKLAIPQARRTLWVLIFLLRLVVWPAQAQDEPKLALVIRGPSTPVKQGDEMIIECVVTNLGPRDYQYSASQPVSMQLTKDFSLVVKTVAGTNLPDAHFPVDKFGNPGPNGQQRRFLQPGESFLQSFTLNRWALIRDPGQYEVLVSYNPASFSQKRFGPVLAPPLELNVLPRSPEEMAAYVADLTNQIAAHFPVAAATRPELEKLLDKLMYTCQPASVPTFLRVASTGRLPGFSVNQALLYYVPKTEATRQAILQAVTSEGLKGNYEALVAGYGFSSEEIRPIIQRALDPSNPSEWLDGARLAGVYYDESFVPRLIVIANDPQTRKFTPNPALDALARHRSDAGVKALKALMNDPDLQFGYALAQAIEAGYRAPLPGDTRRPLRPEDFTGEDLHPLEERFLTSSDSFAQFMGVNLSLLACDDSLIPKVAALATKPTFGRRDLAMVALAVNRTDSGVEALRALLHDPDPTTSDMAAKAIRRGYTRSPEWHGKLLLPEDFDPSFRQPKPPDTVEAASAPGNSNPSPASPAKPGELSSGLSLTIRCLGNNLKVGDEIPIQFHFHNDGTELYTWEDGADYRFELTAKAPAGVAIARPHYNYGPRSGSRSFFGSSHGAAGGGSFDQNIPLNRWAEITEPGTYVVTAVYHPANLANRPVADVVAEPITITVLPKSSSTPVRRRPGTLPASPDWARGMPVLGGEGSSADQLAIWQLIANFEDVSISRPQLLEQAEKFLKTYPASEYATRARDFSDRLKIMIGEDAARTKLTDEQLAALPVEKRVAELIFRLRDQNGQQQSQPGACDFFDDIQGSTNTPAHQLLRLGYPAVPQLTDALSNTNFTRSVGYWRNFRFSHRVLTVGDCALAILQRMSGAPFYVRQTTSSYLSGDGNADDVKTAVREWYGKVQKFGEKETLIQAVETGDPTSIGQANLLLQRYPDSAEEAIMTGIVVVEKSIREQIAADPNSAHFTGMALPGTPDNAATTVLRNRNTHAALVSLLAASPFRDVKLNDFLEQEAKSAPYSRSKVEAAKGLQQRGNSKGLDLMIQEWKTMDHNAGATDAGEELNLADLLVAADSPDAIKALGQVMDKLGPLPHRNVIDRIGGFYGNLQPPKQTQATLLAVESVLLAELDNTEAVPKNALYRESGITQELRWCDLAEEQLAKRWPERYSFDLSAPLAEREKWRSEARGTLRRTPL